MTVTMTLEAGNADFPFVMSDYHLPILPAQDDGTIDVTLDRRRVARSCWRRSSSAFARLSAP
jgi:hypothetical protein